MFSPPRRITYNSTLLCVLFLVNKVVPLPRPLTNAPRRRLHLFVCIHLPYCLRSPHLFCTLTISPPDCSYWMWGSSGRRRKSDQCHLHFISMINGASRGSNQQIWVPGTSEQAPSATAMPEAGRQAGAGVLRWCGREYESVWVHHPELCMVIHINEHLCLLLRCFSCFHTVLE